MPFPPLMTLLNGQGLSPPSVPTPFYDSTKLVSADWITSLGPSAIYSASVNKTFVAWYAVGLAGYKSSLIAAYDHATQTWSDCVKLGNYLLPDDDHGAVSLCRDADGYLYAFFGSHATTQPWSISNAPDDITAWTPQAPLSGNQTSPRPVLIGNTIYVFTHYVPVSISHRVQTVRSATPVAGVATFGAVSTLVDFGNPSRTLRSEAYPAGTDIHFTLTKLNSSDTMRQGVYYFVYDTVTGSVKNHDSSFIVSAGSLPVGLATANTNFRLFDHGSGQGEVPSLCFDSSGDPHVLFSDDGATGNYQLKHIKRTAGVWSSPVIVAPLTDVLPGIGTGRGFSTTFTAVDGSSGSVEAWYINAAGDKLRRVRDASGSWSTVETILAAGSYYLINNQSVYNASADFRVIYSESAPYPASDAGSIYAKRYAHGDSGPITSQIPVSVIDPLYSNVSLLLGFNHRDNCNRFINDANTSLLVTATGNAQTSSSQFKFGSASLLLDGTGDGLTVPHNSLFSVSNGDFCIEAWIKLNSLGKIHCVASKRPSTGSNEWNALVLTTNVLCFQAFSTGGIVVNISGTTPLTTTDWYHVSYVRQGSLWKCLLNGAVEASGTQSATPSSNTLSLTIGRNTPSAAHDFNGRMDEFRFTSGNARYTTSFTAPTAAFPRR